MISAPVTEAKRQDIVRRSLLSARGRYAAERASQLAGIPRSTMYDWQHHGIYAPDFQHATPMAWSYRDLIFLRVLAWLRARRVQRPTAAKFVDEIKHALIRGERIESLHTDGRSVLVNDELRNRFGRQDPFQDVSIVKLMSTFDLLQPIEELGSRPLWGPDLVTPSQWSFISPWVMAGEPCIDDTRIPTSTIHALRTQRGLSSARIVALYPRLTAAAVDDAVVLEVRLRQAA